jgi:hypothetical protein
LPLPFKLPTYQLTHLPNFLSIPPLPPLLRVEGLVFDFGFAFVFQITHLPTYPFTQFSLNSSVYSATSVLKV